MKFMKKASKWTKNGIVLGMFASAFAMQANAADRLGFGIDFSTVVTSDMEQNNPNLPKCDIRELTTDDTEVVCRQGWLRGNSPRTVSVTFPGLERNASVYAKSRWEEEEIRVYGDETLELDAGERSAYDMEVVRRDSDKNFKFKIRIYFYPVAP